VLAKGVGRSNEDRPQGRQIGGQPLKVVRDFLQRHDKADSGALSGPGIAAGRVGSGAAADVLMGSDGGDRRQSQRNAQTAAPHRPRNQTIENQNNGSSRDIQAPAKPVWRLGLCPYTGGMTRKSCYRAPRI
jgi:hypothetical protein